MRNRVVLFCANILNIHIKVNCFPISTLQNVLIFTWHDSGTTHPLPMMSATWQSCTIMWYCSLVTTKILQTFSARKSKQGKPWWWGIIWKSIHNDYASVMQVLDPPQGGAPQLQIWINTMGSSYLTTVHCIVTRRFEVARWPDWYISCLVYWNA